jgi:hypothetical protein
VRGALIQGVAQQRAGPHHLALVERVETLVNERLGNALLLGLRAAGAVDVSAGAVVRPVEKQHARPEIDGLFVLTREVVIEAGHEQMLDPRLVIGAWLRP